MPNNRLFPLTRQIYDAVIIGIHRHGKVVSGGVADSTLQAGDALLLEVFFFFSTGGSG
jgi:hypothetical protein